MKNVADIMDKIAESANGPEKLIFLVGKPGSGKSNVLRRLAVQNSWTYVDCRSLLSEEFLELLPTERPVKAYEIMSKILLSYHSPVIVLDRVQVLFAPLLQVDPLKLLSELSADQKIIAAWPGEYKDGKLIFRFIGQQDALSYEFNSKSVWVVD